MRLLLTGASGRLGGAFLRRLGHRHDIIALHRSACDLMDPASVRAAVMEARADWVVHTAAYNNVDEAEGAGAKEALLMNAYAAGNLAVAAATAGARMLHISTDYVFDGSKVAGYVEDDAPAPVSTYGVSKYLGELAVRACDPRAVIVRTSRLYGPPAASAHAKRSFVDIVRELAGTSATFAINRAEVSSPTLVDDLATHIDQYILVHTAIAPGVYHMANTGGCTWEEWARAIVAGIGSTATVLPRDPAALQRPAKRPEHSVLLSTKLPSMRPWGEALRDHLIR